MKEIHSPNELQKEMNRLRRSGKTIGFVPTMGALHEGHLALVRAARQDNDVVAVSIFVNPLQFGPSEDLKKYPRPIAEDKRKLCQAKTDYLFAPSAAAMYPKGYATAVDISKSLSALSNVLCGKFRPEHFRGVMTVCTKLFMIVKPHRVYFGAKDYQQSVIIRRLIRDLNMDIECKVLSTVREKDGLAISSRNRYLNHKQRQQAAAISRTLFWLRDQIRSGRRDLRTLKREALKALAAEVDQVQYLEIVDPETLVSLERFQPKMTVLTACFVGKTRLIDNVTITAQ